MRHWLKFSSATAGVLVWTAAIGAAAADTYRIPQTGNPALVADAPLGWTGQYTRQNELTISPADDMAALELSVISDPAVAAMPLPEVAAQVFRNSDLPQWTSSEPDSIADLQGQAFIVTVSRAGSHVALRVIIAKIDASHYARLTEITIPKETTSEQLAALKELVSHLSISGR